MKTESNDRVKKLDLARLVRAGATLLATSTTLTTVLVFIAEGGGGAKLPKYQGE